MDFKIRGFKTWVTDDGGGYQFTLYVDGKRFAFVHNAGNGGEIDLKFFDTDAPRVEIVSIYNNQTTYMGTPNEKLLIDYTRALPPTEYEGEPMPWSVGMLMDDLVNKYERDKYLAKLRKKGVVFRLKHDDNSNYRVMNTLDINIAKTFLDSKYPNQYQIL